MISRSTSTAGSSAPLESLHERDERIDRVTVANDKINWAGDQLDGVPAGPQAHHGGSPPVFRRALPVDPTGGSKASHGAPLAWRT
jgi:hypothetical protein